MNRSEVPKVPQLNGVFGGNHRRVREIKSAVAFPGRTITPH
jgi:hypothetical protein